MKKIQGIETVPENISTAYRQISKKRVSESLTLGAEKYNRTVTYSGLGSAVFRGLRLDEILSEIDQYFDHISSSIGGTTIPHEWRLIHCEDPSLTYGLSKLDIHGFRLGADVEIAHGKSIEMSYEYNNQLRDALGSAKNKFYIDNGWYVNDSAFPHQFILGNNPSDKPILVDIDPRVVDYNTHSLAL